MIKYIGIPYKKGGRDAQHGLDCFGLFQLVQRECFNIDLRDLETKELSRKQVANKIEESASSWHEVDVPQNGDAVLMGLKHQASHVGVYYEGGILHCVDHWGCIFNEVETLQQKTKWKIIKYMRYKCR